MNTDIEAIWLELRPSRLPKGIPCIILCNLYHPPCENDQVIISYLIEVSFANCGIIILGDFNKLNFSRLRNAFKLCQIVKFPTRGPNFLDLIFTNMKDFYDDPIERPPFGLSDHGTVETQPLQRSQIRKPKLCIKSRDLRATKRLAMRKYLEEVDVKSIIDAKRSCERKTQMLESIINFGLDTLLPIKTKIKFSNEPPWMSQSLKQLIRRRQRALNQSDQSIFRALRNQVNRQRKTCRAKSR